MTSSTTVLIWWCWFVDWLLADDDYRLARIGGLIAGAIMTWRALWLYSQRTPAARPSRSQKEMEPAPHKHRRWFKSKPEKLALAVREAELKTELVLQKTSSVRATAELEQARAQLNTLLQELKAQAQPAMKPIAPALTLREIDECLSLIQLEPQQRLQFRELLAARIEEKV